MGRSQEHAVRTHRRPLRSSRKRASPHQAGGDRRSTSPRSAARGAAVLDLNRPRRGQDWLLRVGCDRRRGRGRGRLVDPRLDQRAARRCRWRRGARRRLRNRYGGGCRGRWLRLLTGTAAGCGTADEQTGQRHERVGDDGTLRAVMSTHASSISDRREAGNRHTGSAVLTRHRRRARLNSSACRAVPGRAGGARRHTAPAPAWTRPRAPAADRCTGRGGQALR